MKTMIITSAAFALLLLGVVCLIAVPEEGQAMGKFFLLLFLSKAFCALCLFLAWRLYGRARGRQERKEGERCQ